ncbi:MAG: transporter [Gemmatimonadales bacterium]
MAAQTDFYNTDRNRPIQIEDAYPTERYAFELQLAPVRLERRDGGLYNWGIEPEITYGIFPRTHLEIGVPLAFVDGGLGVDEEFGLAGLDLSVLHNLNVETSGLPAFGLAADVVLPVGSLAPDNAYLSLRGIATRTYTWARFHLNGQYTFGSADGVGEGVNSVVELSRWLAGVAVDRTFPLKSTLITAELYVQDPLGPNTDLELNAAGGIRYQLSPQLAVDGGLGRRLTGDDRSWFVTFGAAYAFAIRGLIPVPRR